MSKLIVHIIDRLPPDGAERLIVEVLKNRSGRYRYEVLALVDGGRLVEEIESMSIPVTVLGRRNGHDLTHALKLYRWLQAKNPHAVHTHLFTADAWGRTFAWLARIPGIFSTVHSTNTWKSRIHLAVDRLLAKISNNVIACSQDVHNTISEQGIPGNKLVTIDNGIDLDRIDSASSVDLQTEFGISPQVTVFGLIGRLHEAKGHQDLIPVLDTIARSGVPFKCVFVGEGDLEESLKTEVENRGLSQHVVFAGFRSDVIGILKSLDFIAMPSRWEGLPISLLESMACSTPAIASRVGGIPDVVEHGVDGLLYEQGDNDALASALQSLLSDKNLQQSMATAGAEKIRTQYNAALVTSAYENLYDKVK